MEASVTVTFAGKQAIVTGAGSGIGAALCRALAAAGADVVCTDVDEDAAHAQPHPWAPDRRDSTSPTPPPYRRASTTSCTARPTRPDVQQRRHHLGRRHRTADARPVERDHRRQHPRCRARRGRRLPADGPPRFRPHHQHRVHGGARRGRPDHQLRDEQACGRRPFARAALGGRRSWRRRARGVPDRRRDADPGQGRDRRVRRPRLLPHGSAQRDVLLRGRPGERHAAGHRTQQGAAGRGLGRRALRGCSPVWHQDCCNACPSDSSPSNVPSKPPTPQAARRLSAA